MRHQPSFGSSGGWRRPADGDRGGCAVNRRRGEFGARYCAVPGQGFVPLIMGGQCATAAAGVYADRTQAFGSGPTVLMLGRGGCVVEQGHNHQHHAQCGEQGMRIMLCWQAVRHGYRCDGDPATLTAELGQRKYYCARTGGRISSARAFDLRHTASPLCTNDHPGKNGFNLPLDRKSVV